MAPCFWSQKQLLVAVVVGVIVVIVIPVVPVCAVGRLMGICL